MYIYIYLYINVSVAICGSSLRRLWVADMPSFWFQILSDIFGAERVEDALENTNLAPLGKQHNFGLWVVRAAITADAAKEWMQQSQDDIAEIVKNNVHMHRAVALQGSSKKKTV